MFNKEYLEIARKRLANRISTDEYRNEIKNEIRKGFNYFDTHGRNIDYHHAMRTVGYAKQIWKRRHYPVRFIDGSELCENRR